MDHFKERRGRSGREVLLNATGYRNRTGLHLAVARGNIDLVERLIENGADCDARDREGMTPLHQAAIFGIPEAVKLLIPRSANINALSDQFGTPLAAAAGVTWLSDERSRIECVKILINNKADVNCYGGRFHSPLKGAAAGKSREMVELMLANGAEVDAKGGYHTTALAAAVSSYVKENRKDLILILYLDVESLEAIIAHPGQTISPKAMREAAQAAARNGNLDNLKMLLGKGATIKAKIPGLRPILFEAFDSPDTSVVRYLLGEGRGFIDVDETDAHKTTALAYSIHRKRYDYVQALLDAGANPNMVDDNGNTPIILAAKAGHDSSAQILLSRGGAMALDVVDFAGRGVLYWACYSRLEGVFKTAMELICKGGLEMKKRKANECSLALHAVAAGGMGNMLQTLLRETFADEALLDRNNWSFKKTATEYGRREVYTRLPHQSVLVDLELKRPTSWNRRDTHRQVEISDDGLTITLKDPGEMSMARSDFCMPADPYANLEIYYFEITVEKLLLDINVERGIELSVGFCQEHVPLNKFLGFESGSWGYISFGREQVGSIYTNGVSDGQHIGVCDQGTTIGCGVNFRDQTAFFTKDGTLVRTDKVIDNVKGKVYPAVTFGRNLAAGSSISANFGNKPEIEFQYKPRSLGPYSEYEGHGHAKDKTTKRKRDLREKEDSEDPEDRSQKRKVNPELITPSKPNSQDTSTETETPGSPITLQQADNTYLAPTHGALLVLRPRLAL